MVSPLTFPHMRSRGSSSEKKKGLRRPPPLKLESSFFKTQDKSFYHEPEVRAVRGSISGPSDKETDLPLRRTEMKSSKPAVVEQPAPESMKTPTAAAPQVPKKDTPVDDRKDSTPKPARRQAIQRQSPGPIAETRSASPEQSMRNIIHLDLHDSDDEPSVSPGSGSRPAARHGNGTALTRFFPELSSNVSLVPSANTQSRMEPQVVPRSFETELEARVHTLYMSSADAEEEEEEMRESRRHEDAPEYEEEEEEEAVRSVEQTRSSSGSEEIFDAASSCYSRRSSVTSIDTHYMTTGGLGVYKSSDAFSIFSPVAAGVFDDASSFRSRAPLKVSSRAQLRLSSRISSPTRRPGSVNSVDTHYVSGEAKAQYKSADAFSIASPAAAGVFDDSASMMATPRLIPSQSASSPSSQTESFPPIRIQQSILMRDEFPDPISASSQNSTPTETQFTSGAESPVFIREESPDSTRTEIPASVEPESLAPTRYEPPASTRNQSQAPIQHSQHRSSAVVQVEVPSSMPAELPATARTDSSSSVQVDSPAPMRAESSASMPAELPADTRTDSPAPIRAESPTPMRTESSASMPTRLSTAMRTESPAPLRAASATSLRKESPAPLPVELPAIMRTESPASMRVESPAPMPVELPASMWTESPASSRAESPVPIRASSPYSQDASSIPPQSPMEALERGESPVPVIVESAHLPNPPTRLESPAPVLAPMRFPMRVEPPAFSQPATRAESPAPMRVASPAPSQATSQGESPSPHYIPVQFSPRPPSIASTTVSTIPPYQYVPSASTFMRVPTEGRNMNFANPWRTNSVLSKVSLNDIKNKPLPLEPVSEPSPLDIRRNEPSHPAGLQQNVYPSSRYPMAPQSRMQYPSSPAHQLHSGHAQSPRLYGDAAYHQFHSHNDQQSRRGRRPDWTEHPNGSGRLRHIPTLSQAAEELEEALAGLANDPNRHQKTLLILDGPLQISRHNGDLVAARPAPLPPSVKPYSKSNRSPSVGPPQMRKKDKGVNKSKSKPVDDTKERKQSSGRSIREVPHKEKSEKNLKQGRAPEDLKEKGANIPKGKDRVEGNHRKASTQKPVEEDKKDDKRDKLKLKKSFTLSMRTFHRKHDLRPDVPDMPSQRLSVLTSRSENSIEPPPLPGPISNDMKGAKSKAEPRLSRHLSLTDPKLGLAPLVAPNKVDDLRLQLPRLQTQDLGLKSLKDKFGPVQESQSHSDSPLNPAGMILEINNRNERSLPLHVTPPPEDEKILVVSEKMRQNHAFVSTAQASSAYVLPEHIYELAATPPTPTSIRPERTMEVEVEVTLEFPAEFPDTMILSIMEEIMSLDDLFNFVLVNKQFFRVFKQHELPLIKNALFKMSPPAWELRELSPPWTQEWQHILNPDSRVPEYTPSLYLDRYAQDIYTLAQLKSLILVRCSPFLRRDTVRGLSGVDIVRAEEVDDAFWRIWTFCRIFGSGKGRENDIEGQKDWLKGGVKAQNSLGASMTEPFGINNVLFEPPEGFARGNAGGLSPKQLYDMTEIWTCLGVLLQPLHGKCIEAREMGIFEGMDVPEGDAVREELVLEEWTAYVLTLGLSAVLTLSSLCPIDATSSTFSKAKLAGLTKWELPELDTTRSSFLKEAVSRVYEDQERSLSPDSASPHEQPLEKIQWRGSDRERQQGFALELRNRRQRSNGENGEPVVPVIEERPMSEFSTIGDNFDEATPRDAPPVPPVPPLDLDRSSSSTSSTGTDPRTPNPTPPRSHTPDSSIPFTRSPPSQASLAPPPLQPQVQDPVDRAISRMVNQLGFREDDVKWALKITDTGEGLDVEAAEQLLKQQRKKHERNPFAPRSGKNSLLMSVMKRQNSQESGWRWA